MKNELKNEHAQQVAARAFKWVTHSHNTWQDDLGMLKSGATDYLDLMEIAIMIESNQPKKNIARKMWDLDTVVRDEIPNQVYDFYTAK